MKTGNKKLLSTILSLAMALVLMVGFAFSPAASVAAVVGEVESLSAGQTKTFTTSGEEIGYVSIDIQETGLYQFVITDNYSGINYTEAYLFDDVSGGGYYIVDEKISSAFTSTTVLLFANCDYELAFYNYNENGEGIPYSCPGSLAITFEKLNSNPTVISSTPITESVTVEQDVYLEYTTSTSGDYTLNFSALSAYISVFNANTGELITQRDTEYRHGDWVAGTKLVFNLAANTKYYFCVSNYNEDANIMFWISENSKTVKNVEPSSLAVWVDSYTYIDAQIFDYKVSYLGGTSSTKTYLELCQAGIETPDVYSYDDEIYANGWLIEGGKTPVVCEYKDTAIVIYVDVESITDWLVSDGLRATDEYDICSIEYESDDEYTYWWRIKVSETGYYGIWRYDEDAFSDIFEFYNIEIIDEYNHIVQYNENIRGWPLVKDREYALSFNYKYDDSYTYNEVEFWLQKDPQRMYSDVSSGDWFNDAVTYAGGRGIMSGYGGTSKFGSADGIQRQDFLVMLARLEGVYLDWYDYESPFPDVPRGSYYEAAINWGYENGIVSGYQNGDFGVGDKITREQIVTFLYRYANYSLADTDYSMTEDALKGRFSDYSAITDYAIEPMLWAVENGVISGQNGGKAVVPYGNALRCEVAQIMFNIHKNDII